MKKFKIEPCYDKSLIDYLQRRWFPGDRVFTGESADWVVRADDGNLVGFCMLAVDYMGRPDVAFLARAAVAPDARGHNLHVRMLRTRERYARRVGITRIYTYTSPRNIKSNVNLQRASYTLYEPPTLYVGKKWLYWQKHLKKDHK